MLIENPVSRYSCFSLCSKYVLNLAVSGNFLEWFISEGNFFLKEFLTIPWKNSGLVRDGWSPFQSNKLFSLFPLIYDRWGTQIEENSFFCLIEFSPAVLSQWQRSSVLIEAWPRVTIYVALLMVFSRLCLDIFQSLKWFIPEKTRTKETLIFDL